MVAQIPTPAMIRSNQKVVSHGPRVLQHPFSHIRHHRFELEAEEVARGICETLGGPCQRMQCPGSGDRSEAR